VPLFNPNRWSQYVATLPKSAVSPVDFQKFMASPTITQAGRAVSTELFLALVRFGLQVNKLSNNALEEQLRQLEQDQIWEKYLEPRLEIPDDERLEKVALAFEKIAQEQKRETDLQVSRDAGLEERLRRAQLEIEKRDEIIQNLLRERSKDKKREASRKRYQRMTGQDKRRK
jgi:hypothetical protein